MKLSEVGAEPALPQPRRSTLTLGAQPPLQPTMGFDEIDQAPPPTADRPEIQINPWMNPYQPGRQEVPEQQPGDREADATVFSPMQTRVPWGGKIPMPGGGNPAYETAPPQTKTPTPSNTNRMGPVSGWDQLLKGLSPIGSAQAAPLSEVGNDPGEPPKRQRLSTVGMAPQQPQQGGSGASALWQGILQGLGNVPRGAAQLATRLPITGHRSFAAGTPANQISQDLDAHIAQREQEYQADPTRRAHPVWAGLGQFIGEFGATAPLMAAGPAAGMSRLGRIGQGAMQGAAGGAVQPVAGGDYWTQKGLQAGFGAAAGGAIPAIGGAVTRTPAAQQVMGKGVELTSGMQIGETARHSERMLQAFPILRGMVTRGEARSIDSYNRATMNQALDPIGAIIGPNVKAGHDLIDAGASAASAAYSRILPQVMLTEDDILQSEMRSLRNLVSEGGDDLTNRFERVLKRAMDTRFGADPKPPVSQLKPAPRTDELGQMLSLEPHPVPTAYVEPRLRNMDGTSLKEVERDLDKAIRLNRVSGADATQRQLADALMEARSIVFRALGRQNPAHAEALDRLDTSWAMLSRIRDAAVRRADSEGRFTPADMLQAIKAGERRFGDHWSFAKGDGLMQAFAEEANRVIGKTGSGATQPHGILHETARLLGGVLGAIPYAASRGLPPVGKGVEIASPYLSPVAGAMAGEVPRSATTDSYYRGRGYTLP